MKDGLHSTGKKNRKKTGKNCMHWNVAPDALPGSARLVRVLDHWRNDCLRLCLFDKPNPVGFTGTLQNDSY